MSIIIFMILEIVLVIIYCCVVSKDVNDISDIDCGNIIRRFIVCILMVIGLVCMALSFFFDTIPMIEEREHQTETNSYAIENKIYQNEIEF